MPVQQTPLTIDDITGPNKIKIGDTLFEIGNVTPLKILKILPLLSAPFGISLNEAGIFTDWHGQPVDMTAPLSTYLVEVRIVTKPLGGPENSRGHKHYSRTTGK